MTGPTAADARSGLGDSDARTLRHNPFSPSPPDFKTLYIFGAGGHGREVAWLASQVWGGQVTPVFIVDEQFTNTGRVDGILVRSPASLVPDTQSRFVVAIGNCASRRRVADRCAVLGLRPTTLVHPRAEMSTRVQLAEGVVICAGSVLTTNVVLDAHVHINVNCSVSHDVRIGAFSTLSPGVHMSGHVHIGEDVFIGTGANIANGTAAEPLTIGDGAIIAAGACVIGAVEPGALMAGVPAIRKR